MTLFAKLSPDGSMTDVRVIDQSDMMKCKFSIMVPEHYRLDGSCKCDDADYRKMMIEEWGYSPKDFRGLPLRVESRDLK